MKYKLRAITTDRNLYSVLSTIDSDAYFCCLLKIVIHTSRFFVLSTVGSNAEMYFVLFTVDCNKYSNV